MSTPLPSDSRMALALGLVAALVLAGCGPQAAVSPSPTQTAAAATQASLAPPATSVPPSSSSVAASTDRTGLPVTDPASGLPYIEPADLPPEALETLALIEAGGPFPFDRDGITFQNREGLLPDEAGGYYREFTVVTPGLSDRGPRRIVAGEGGERYYTADHYESFERVRLAEAAP